MYPNHVLQLNQGPKPASGYKLCATIWQKSTSFLRLKSWSWVPEVLVSAFTIHKQPGHLAAVVAFTRPDQTKFTILLGSLDDLGDVGVVLAHDHPEKSFREWAQDLDINGPRPCRRGVVANLGPHSVVVTGDERVFQNTKYFAVSVAIREHPKPEEDVVAPSDVLPGRPKTKARGIKCIKLKSKLRELRKWIPDE